MHRILIIEDDVTIVDDLIVVFELEGFEAAAAENGRIGVEIAKQYLPDIIICDIMMPEMDGYEVLRELQLDPTTASIPFIFLSAKADRQSVRFGMDLGADDYLTKPFNIEEVVSAVRSRLAKRAQRSSEYQQQTQSTHPPDGTPTLVGSTIHGYEIWEKIGEGGWGSVYKAYQPSINRDVAIKVIQEQYAHDDEFMRRFRGEAEVIARLEHPHIVPLYDFWHDDNGMFIVMRFVKGGSLRDALEREGAWSAKRAAQVLDQVVSALAVAHNAGIIHRDLKPDNILLDEHGNAYLSDFGLAKTLIQFNGEAQSDQTLLRLLEHETEFIEQAATTLFITGHDQMIGTPAYLSPEQIRAEPLSIQCDIYSLGITLYETLIGRNAFQGDVQEVIMKQLQEDLTPIHQLRPDLPEAISAVLHTATAKDPKHRYGDVLRLAADFRKATRQK